MAICIRGPGHVDDRQPYSNRLNAIRILLLWSTVVGGTCNDSWNDGRSTGPSPLSVQQIFLIVADMRRARRAVLTIDVARGMARYVTEQ